MSITTKEGTVSIIKSWLCRLGLHKWKFHDIVDKQGDSFIITTYSWCARCNLAPMKVNIEERHLD